MSCAGTFCSAFGQVQVRIAEALTVLPVIFNFFFVGAELAYLFMPDNFLMGVLINGTYVAIGEVIAVILGYILVRAFSKTKIFDE